MDTPRKILLVYLIIGMSYVVWSDYLLSSFGLSKENWTFWQNIKGVSFVLLTGLLAYTIIRRDFDSLRKSQKALKLNEAKLRALLDALPDTLLRISKDGVCLDLKGVAKEKILPRSIVGKKIEEIFPCELVDKMYHYITLATEQGKLSSFEYICQIEESRYCEIRVSPLEEDQVFFIHTDITNRKQAEIDLQKSERFIESILKATPGIVYIFDIATGKIVYTSQNIASYLGYTSEELGQVEGNVIMRLVHPNDVRRAQKAFVKWQRIKEDKIFTTEYRLRTKSGEWRWFAIRDKVFHRNEEGEVEQVIGIAYDIDEKKKAEEERKVLEEELRQSKKMEAIGTLAGGIAHDFNNILAAMIGYTELTLLQTKNNSLVQGNLKNVLQAGNRAKELVKQILTFSRMEGEAKKAVDLAPIVEEVYHFLRASLPAMIEIRKNIAQDMDYVLAEPTHIHQVIMNLATNAAQAMKKQGGVLEIELSQLELQEKNFPLASMFSEGKYLCLRVSDSGGGIPSEIKDRIFEPYFTTKEKGEGTGLGLATVHGIVKNHGGFVTVDNLPGKGASFSIYLPTVAQEKDEQTSAYNSSFSPVGKGKVLFVDDEPMLAELGQAMLSSLGFDTAVETSSEKALELFRESPHQYDLIITDMTMPRLRGDQLARAAMNIRKDIPIILCTGYSELINEERASEMGIRGFLFKPFSRENFARVISKVVTDKK